MDNLTKLRYWTFKILPLVYDDSLSYYEVLAKVTNKVNELVDSNNTMPQAITDEITKQLDESYAADINNKINNAVNTVTENANNQIDKLANEVYANLISAIATDEGTNTFTKDAKSGGELIFLNGTLYKVTAVMPAGTNYLVGTNIIPVDISKELKNIKETYLSSNNEYWNERSTNNYNAGIYLFWKDILYITTKDIHTNDILYADSDNQNLRQVTLAKEISDNYNEMHNEDEYLQTQIDVNNNDIKKLQQEQTNQNNRIDNIVAQSGNDNTEIVDARKWASSFGEKTSATLYTALNNQFNKIYTEWMQNKGVNSLPLDLNDCEISKIYKRWFTGNETLTNGPLDKYPISTGAIVMTIGVNSDTLFKVQLYIQVEYKKYFNMYLRYTGGNGTWSVWRPAIFNNGNNLETEYGTVNDETLKTSLQTLINNIYTNSLYQTNTLNYGLKDLNNIPWNKIWVLYNTGSFVMPDNLPRKFNTGEGLVLITLNTNQPILKTQIVIDLSKSITWTRYTTNSGWSSWKKFNSNAPKTINVGPNEEYTTLKSAIDFANNTENTTIIIHPGVYNPVSEGLTEQGYQLKNSMHIIGMSGATIKTELSTLSSSYSPINLNYIEKDAVITIEGITVEETNCRYCIHDEQGGDEDTYPHTYIHKYNNINFISHTQDHRALGCGMRHYGRVEINNCTFETNTTTTSACDFHANFTGLNNNKGQNDYSVVYINNSICKNVKIATISDPSPTITVKGVKGFVCGCLTKELPTSNNEATCPMTEWNNKLVQ